MTDLRSLKSKIDERLKREMVPAFLDKYERWHKRKGLRDCYCEYCQIKRRATIEIGKGRKYPPLHGKRIVDPETFEAMLEVNGEMVSLHYVEDNFKKISRDGIREEFRKN